MDVTGICQLFALKAEKCGEKFKSLSFGFGFSPKSVRKALSRLKNHHPVIHPPNPPSSIPPVMEGDTISSKSEARALGPAGISPNPQEKVTVAVGADNSGSQSKDDVLPISLTSLTYPSSIFRLISSHSHELNSCVFSPNQQIVGDQEKLIGTPGRNGDKDLLNVSKDQWNGFGNKFWNDGGVGEKCNQWMEIGWLAHNRSVCSTY